jgi:NADH:ubiquinone oxidoreductase subunit F (NADH-binding)
MTKLAPVLSAHWDERDSFTIEAYKRHGGYTASAKALAMDPDAVIQLVKDSGLRGRGGLGGSQHRLRRCLRRSGSPAQGPGSDPGPGILA